MSQTHVYGSMATADSQSRFARFFCRVPLLMITVIFTLISLRYLLHPVEAAAKVGIAFTSPGGITVARVGFAAFPLSFAILAAGSLLIGRRLLPGLYLALTVASVVLIVRLLGIAMDHSAAENARLLLPEALLVALSASAIWIQHRQGSVAS